MNFLLKSYLLILIILVSNQAIAGWVIAEVSSDKFGNKQYQTTFIQNNMIRFENEATVAIINLKTGNIILLFDEYKLYWQGSIKEFKENTLDVYEQKLNNIIITGNSSQKIAAQNLITKLREQNETVNNDSIAKFKIQIDKTTVIENIAGFNAYKYNIAIDDSLIESIWVTDSINPYRDIDIESMVSFTNELIPGDNENSIEGSPEYLNLIKEGLAVKSQEINPQGGFFTTVVTGVLETNIKDELFLPPPNFQKTQLAEIILIVETNSGKPNRNQEFNKAQKESIYD